ncbi:formate hydrogenlyase subunit 3/multisubunit Na+/H+ antiporter, MnhD subunit [Desulfitobacterium dichloroeliminans LMG P-21439]|uniref:Formate hydrogenlyase subunit 3/multisubunit Na+/H+ antiporter, MnhD subunit n=1 Tax=Desulfitobacterium dichloroeliminans (strain LMG P-21439 / DCA1) TaxID=871963 RepID=L0F4V8_DESDL|nr:Na+/H+ antiporter subunit D [Desulfitobacterium dichloroeliminans]AGA67701.1 formate hydrogenlyase subunit 3/multisubunit Na+/H+ antiporter, MnhD subunit [Desulfitobacterium dichloroeliminans LMG P-21439]
MNNVVVLPLVIPMLAGLLMAMMRRNIGVQRVLSVISIALVFGVALKLVQQVRYEGIQTLAVGGWQAPYGIVLVADMFSVLLVLTASLVAMACILFAFQSIGKEREQYYFYSLFQFLLVGVNGSFLTGDLFNLFVFFEVMLFSSYVLLSLGGTKRQLKGTIKYVVINSLSSTIFLLGIAYLYAVVGTLNMAHLSVRIAEIGQGGYLTAVALVFMVVFSLKAALFLFFWLPEAYSAPPTVVGAVFAALLTKVGIYALFRMFTLVFYHQPEVTHTLLAIMAGLTLLLGSLGAVAYRDIHRILGYNVIIGVGFIVAGLAIFTQEALMGALYYLLHDIVTKALLFLLGGIIILVAGSDQLKKMGGMIRGYPFLGWLFLLTTLALGGIPPLSGFLGKVLIVQEGLARGVGEMGFYGLTALALLSSLLVLFSLIKIFILTFWGEARVNRGGEKKEIRGLLIPCAGLLVVSIGLGVGAEMLYPYIEQAGYGLMNPEVYIKAVLSEVI